MMRARATTILRLVLLAFLAALPLRQSHAALPTEETDLHPGPRDQPIELYGADDGMLYLSDHGRDEVWVIDPASGAHAIYPYLSDASDAKPDADGAIWFTNEGNEFNRLDPGANVVKTWAIGEVGDVNLWGVAYDEGGDVWLSDWYHPTGALYKYDPAGGTLCTYPIPGGSASYYLLYDSPYLWFANWGEDRIYRLDPTAGSDQLRWWTPDPVTGPPDLKPLGLALDGAGGIWWADRVLHALAHLDPATGQATRYDLPVGSDPQKVLVRDGLVWYTESSGATFGSLDPASATGTEMDFVSGAQDAGPAALPCPALEVARTQDVVPTTGTSLPWSENEMALAVDAGGWLVYQLPATAKAYDLAVGADRWWLTDYARRVLIREGGGGSTVYLPVVLRQ